MRQHTTSLISPRLIAVTLSLISLLGAGKGLANTRSQTFDSDPGWDGHNNRVAGSPQQVTQNFGYSSTNLAGAPNDTTGEVGGVVTPAGEAAYYGKSITPKTLEDRLTASGNLYVETAGHHTLLGFFNSGGVDSGWRNPNHFVLRLQEEGNSSFKAFADYSTSLWRAGGVRFLDRNGSDFLFSTGQSYQWAIDYYPNGNNGNGSYEAVIANSTIGTQRTGLANLAPGRKLDGATVNRFGLFNSVAHYDDRAGRLWMDDLTINNSPVDTFAQNPNWDSLRNNTTYNSSIVRPRFNFGYSPTQHARGAGSGEMGGFTWKGDSRPEFDGARMAYYGDMLDETLTLDNKLEASGKVSLKVGVTDSATHIGFFHSTDSLRDSTSQTMQWPENFVGVTIEGPTDEGFFFYPTYGTNVEGEGSDSRGDSPPRIYPNGESLDWTLVYDPDGGPNGFGQMIISLDGDMGVLNLTGEHRGFDAHFDRFGIVTTHIDGNGQEVYFDDLTYTVSVPEPASLGFFSAFALLALRRIRR